MPATGASGQLWLAFSGEGARLDVCEVDGSGSCASGPVDEDGVSTELEISLLRPQTEALHSWLFKGTLD